MSEEKQAVAILAALNAVLPNGRKAYDLDEVPATLPTSYVEIGVSRRYAENTRLAPQQQRVAWRVTTRAVASRSVSDAREMHRLTRQALGGARLPVDGVLTSPIQFETEEPVGPDGDSRDWFSGLISWTYTHGGHPHA